MAQQVYALQSDMSVPAKALADVSSDTINLSLSRASSIADGYLRKRFNLPLRAYTQSLSQAVADIATWIVMKDRGFNASAESTKEMRTAYLDALDWLERVAGNKIDPAFIDSTGEGQDETSSVDTAIEKPAVYYAAPGTGMGWGGSDSGSNGGCRGGNGGGFFK